MKKIPLTREIVREWYKHPVTRMFIQECKDRRDNHAEEMLVTYAKGMTCDSIALNIAHHTGVKESIEWFLEEEEMISYLQDCYETTEEN